MAKVFLQTSDMVVGAIGATRWALMGCGSTLSPSNTEGPTQTAFPAGTASLLTVRVATNASASDSTVRTRKNGANGGMSIVVPAGVTGDFEDATGSDTIADGDLMNYEVVPVGSGFGLVSIGVTFDATTDRTVVLSHPGSSTLSVRYFLFGGGGDPQGTEGPVQQQITIACTARRLRLRVTANAATSDTPWMFRKNAADTALVVTIPAGVIGDFEDATNSVALLPGDLINEKITPGGGSLSFGPGSVWLDYTAGAYQSFGGTTSNVALNFGETRYMPPGGKPAFASIEANAQWKLRTAERVGNLYVRVASNTCNGDATATVRDEAADTTVTLTIPAGTTGWFSHTTNTRDFDIGDKISVKYVAAGTSGAVQFRMQSLGFGLPLPAQTLNGSPATELWGATMGALAPGAAMLAGSPAADSWDATLGGSAPGAAILVGSPALDEWLATAGAAAPGTATMDGSPAADDWVATPGVIVPGARVLDGAPAFDPWEATEGVATIVLLIPGSPAFDEWTATTGLLTPGAVTLAGSPALDSWDATLGGIVAGVVVLSGSPALDGWLASIGSAVPGSSILAGDPGIDLWDATAGMAIPGAAIATGSPAFDAWLASLGTVVPSPVTIFGSPAFDEWVATVGSHTSGPAFLLGVPAFDPWVATTGTAAIVLYFIEFGVEAIRFMPAVGIKRVTLTPARGVERIILGAPSS